MKVDELAKLVRSPFAEIFPTSPLVLEAVTEAMRTWGYDPSQPVIVWDEGQAVIDGHTRIKAAQAAGIEDIPVHYKSFESEYEALAYAIRLKRRCRKFTDAEIFRCIEALDHSAKLEG